MNNKGGFITRLLIKVSNRARPDCRDYPQTWWLYTRTFKLIVPVWIPLRRRLYRLGKNFWQRICGWFVGHELSETEKGYGGGPYEDRHCRWCDKVFQVPLGEFAKEYGGELLTKESCHIH